MTKQSMQDRLAVLIDADNAPAVIVEGLLAEVAKYGVASVKRIYGDWSNPHIKGWKEVLLEHALQPIQQFGYTKGKNATDSAMIIDAMDLLYSGRFDGFCLVSSDSDFTPLASRIREQGLIVYGFGERKTPRPFVSSCDKFIFTEILSSPDSPEPAPKKKIAHELKRDTHLVNLLRNAVDSSADEAGWANLAAVGYRIAKQVPEFDSRNYGYQKLSELITATSLFAIDKRAIGEEGKMAVFVGDKRRKRS